MIRSLALTASLLVAGAAPALAQTHPGSHDPSRVHGPGHVRPDSATHAALHALLHGDWTGTLTSPHGVSSGMVLSVAHDSLRRVALTMSMDHPTRGGIASDLVMDGAKLRWRQHLSGKGTSCGASALLSAATSTAREAITGTMSCDDGESTFTLHKKTE